MLFSAFLFCLVIFEVKTWKVYSPCELATELLNRHKFTRSEIADWVCLVEAESSYRTHVIGPNNTDGSRDHGLFQINDKYWCSPPGPHNECAIDCSKLTDDDITDDISCVKKVFRVHGFEAWYGWSAECKDKDLKTYLEGCDLSPSKETPLKEQDTGDKSKDPKEAPQSPSSRSPTTTAAATPALPPNEVNAIEMGDGLRKAIPLVGYIQQFNHMPQAKGYVLYLVIPNL